jgi:hypothetical protein
MLTNLLEPRYRKLVAYPAYDNGYVSSHLAHFAYF